MKSNPLTTEKRTDRKNQELRICQACGDVAELKTYEFGAPDTVSGHWTRNCDEYNSYVHSHQVSPFGIVIPYADSDIIWDFQTNGLMCSHPKIRGFYIPLSTPGQVGENIDFGRVAYEPQKGYISLLSVLVSTNYKNNTGDDFDTDYIWELIDDRLSFAYTEVEAPTGYPKNHEAWKWIKLTSADTENSFTNVERLVGERVLFVYPNSD